MGGIKILGTIKNIEKVHNLTIKFVPDIYGTGGRLGVMQMLNTFFEESDMDGFKVETDKHVFQVLIDNFQSCCEEWGYMISEDNPENFIGAELREVCLTDTALNQAKIDEQLPYGFDGSSIQFVDFVTDRGVFQVVVYNAHNGYYGHGIMVTKDDEILLNDTL